MGRLCESFDRSAFVVSFETSNSTMNRWPEKFSGLKKFRRISFSPTGRTGADIQISVGRTARIPNSNEEIERTLNAPLSRSSTSKNLSFPLVQLFWSSKASATIRRIYEINRIIDWTRRDIYLEVRCIQESIIDCILHLFCGKYLLFIISKFLSRSFIILISEQFSVN